MRDILPGVRNYLWGGRVARAPSQASLVRVNDHAGGRERVSG